MKWLGLSLKAFQNCAENPEERQRAALAVVDETDTKWANTDWFPRKSSVSRMAVVVRQRAVTKMRAAR